MKRPVTLLSIIAAAWLAAPVAIAGDEILKCVDTQGHVTLTDRPCASGNTVLRLTPGTEIGPAPAAARQALPVTANMRQLAAQRATIPRPAPLARDIATLREARRAMQLLDSPQPRLAGLQ